MESQQEIWKSVEGYYGYEVSNLGNLRSFHTGSVKPVKKFINAKTGYEIVHLSSPGMKRITKNVHPLVANAFIENPNNYSSVDHKNENKLDNSVSNLRYMPKKENCQRSTSRPIELENIITGEKRYFISSSVAGEYLGVNANAIRSSARTLKGNGKERVCRNHHVRFIDTPPSFFVDAMYETIQLKKD